MTRNTKLVAATLSSFAAMFLGEVLVQKFTQGHSALYPSPVKNPDTGELEYPLFSAEEVAERWPDFGYTVEKPRVRDID